MALQPSQALGDPSDIGCAPLVSLSSSEQALAPPGSALAPGTCSRQMELDFMVMPRLCKGCTHGKQSVLLPACHSLSHAVPGTLPEANSRLKARPQARRAVCLGISSCIPQS